MYLRILLLAACASAAPRRAPDRGTHDGIQALEARIDHWLHELGVEEICDLAEANPGDAWARARLRRTTSPPPA